MKRVFIANRAEIASRIVRAARLHGIESVVAFPACDADLPYVREADVTHELATPRDFMDVETMIATARSTGAEAIHPGYGFLSESAEFARRCEEAGLIFIGPPAEVIAQMADKATARAIAQRVGIPVLPGTESALIDDDQALQAAVSIGFPVMVKAVSAGGGIGMMVARDVVEFDRAFESATARGRSVFGDPRVLVERYVEHARHIEVQVMGLPDGTVIDFAERDCSVQRRHQKVIEESPSPSVGIELRAELRAAANRLTREVGYRNAGTVEFLLDLETARFYFLEMNTRLQVEHPITEAVHHVDLASWQFDVAKGSSDLPATQHGEPSGHAFEFRIYAEDPRTFLPKPGRITRWRLPEGPGIRVDAGYQLDNLVTPYFDPLLAKLVVTAADRAGALELAREAIEQIEIEGPGCNAELLHRVVTHEQFMAGQHTTGLVNSLLAPAPR